MIRRWQAQLKGCVEVVLLLFATMHHLSVPYNDKSAVTDICCVDGTGLTVKDHHTCCAATYATNVWLRTLNIMGEIQIIIHILNYVTDFIDWREKKC